ncbi:hypothetical protein B0H19DRAFT_1086204 [Mycena capillaripes]|nr:hypothetical protein B0H19DRAFT_1086204 [Mycena capillaripes]
MPLPFGVAFFVTSRAMEFCTPSSIAFWCMDASTEVQERPQEFLQQQSIPFIVASDNWTDAADKAPHAIKLPIPYPSASSEEELFRQRLSTMSCYSQHLFRPDYGIIAATVRGFRWEGQRSSIVHFWQGRSAADGDLNIGPGFFYELPDVIRQTAVGPSGRYMLLLVHKQRDGLGGTNPHGYLGLLHFNPTATPHSTFRKLDIEAVTSLSCVRIALDDSLGMVLVADIMGTVTVYSFV